MTHVLIRRSGTLIDISPDGTSPLDPHIVALLRPLLTYEHKTVLRGHNRYSADGTPHNIDIELRNMFAIEEGRLVTGFGFLTSIAQILQGNGITCHYIDISPPKPPGVYEPDWDNLRRYVQFRPKQEECLWYITQNQCGLIDAAMGFGKTELFTMLALLYPRARFDIVVDLKDVAESIVRRLSKTLPNIGQVGGGARYYGDRITVYTAGSAHHCDGRADFLLADEAHLLMTTETSRAMAQAWRFTRNFGFTGTPDGRLDGADAQLEMFFGRKIFYLSYPEAVSLGLVVPIHVRWIAVNSDYNPAKDKVGVPKLRWGIWRNTDRNRAIAEDVRQNYPDPNTQILILTDTTEHAIMLWQFLPEFALCYGSAIERDDLDRYKKNRYLPENFQETTPERRNEMRSQFENGVLKRVIATDVWATGVDFVNLQVMYRTDVRESSIRAAQGPARVSRIAPGTNKAVGEVVDICDNWDKSFRRKSDVRRRHYAKLGWTQTWPGNGRL